MKAVIMAGGKGTRISSVAEGLPKSMVPILGKPVLEHQILCLKNSGISDIMLVTGYKGEYIRNYFGGGSGFKVRLSYFNEEEPMGTAGALYYIKDWLDDDFILLMGDLMLSVDFNKFMAAHKETGAWATLFTHPNSHPFDSDIIVTKQRENMDFYLEKNWGINNIPPYMKRPRGYAGALLVTGVIGKHDERKASYHNQVNAGVYALSKKAAELVEKPEGRKIDLDKDLVRPLIEKGGVYAYSSAEYVKDMGTPERYREAVCDAENNMIPSPWEKRKCIFLDRDGTVMELIKFLNDPKLVKLIPGAAEAVKRINKSGYLAVVITNQPVICRGEGTFESYREVANRFETLLGAEGAYVDATYICPHHDDKGFKGEVEALKFKCRCRKPQPGLIEWAAYEMDIDIKNSYLIGDANSDILSGERAGVKTIRVSTGEPLSRARVDANPDMLAPDLKSAVELIFGKEEN